MSQHLYGIHDAGGEHLMADKPGWIVVTEAIGSDPNDTSGRDYRQLQERGFTVIVRLNNGYYPGGTIPAPSEYAAFAQRCANFVMATPWCTHFVIGNEPNHAQEQPHGQPIYPGMYADCFNQCYAAIKAVRPDARVITAPVAPWDATTKYPANANGDWVVYFVQMLMSIPYCDGVGLHTYTHSAGVNLITSSARMDAPFSHHHYEFRAYRDFMEAMPPEKRNLPVYITETDQVQPWTDANTGWVQAAYAEIDGWNQAAAQKIMCLCLYRWSTDDQWCFANKQGVQNDFRAAVGRGYSSPVVTGANAVQEKIFVPYVPNQTTPMVGVPDLPPREISEDFKRRVPTITLVDPQSGSTYYRLIRAEYVPDGARRFGPDHHILVDVLDGSGKREMGTPVNFYWGSGMEITPVNKVNGPYGADYGMTSPGYGFGVWVGNFRQNSDDVFGMGLGTIEQPDWNHHVTYYLVFQKTAVAAQPVPSPMVQPPPSQVPMLAHPVADPRYRVVTQGFGVNGDYYKRFSVDKVPLKGHNGIDFGTPEGAQIVAVDDGWVIESANDPGGFGEYVKLGHAWGESLYAHLSGRNLLDGRVGKGGVVGRSGWTGNVDPVGPAGAHLHFGMRVNPYNRQDGWGGYIDPAPYLINVGVPTSGLTSKHDIVKAICLAALEFGVDSDLLLSQAWAESSFNLHAVSSAGAQGLFQFMPATWAEWGPKVGATDPFDVTDSARVGAAYMQWLTKSLGGNVFDALVAYGWGVGNVLGDEPYPAVWTEYANKIIHGRDLLTVVS